MWDNMKLEQNHKNNFAVGMMAFGWNHDETFVMVDPSENNA